MRNYSKPIAISGFLVLSVMVIVLLITASNQAWITRPAAGIFVVIISVGTTIEILLEGKNLFGLEIQPEIFSVIFFEFLAVVVGAVTTFYLSIEIGLGAVVASCVVGILAAMTVPKYSAPAYCGAFVGMSSSALFFHHTDVVLASAIAGIVYVMSRNVFAGFGGKLGTIALIGASSAGIILGREFLVAPIPVYNTMLWLLLFALIAAPLTFYLNCNLGNGPVLASGAVGLLGGLILPVVFPDIGNQLAIVVVCASYTGMSNTKRCPRFWHMLIAGLFTGVLFIFSVPLLGGAGGKLGTIAFASIIAVDGFIYIYQKINQLDDRRHANQAQH